MNPTPTPSSPDPLDDPRVFAAVREYQAELEAGRCPDRAAFLARHAEVAPVLAGCLRALTFVQNALPPPGELRADTTLGDFRIVREVGRGGMGVVYEAVQVSLGRRVALKVLPATASLDDRQRQRFKNEALAAAGLDHPHIVPVIAVGAEHDIHYLAMQFIAGPTLAAVVAQLARAAGQAETPGLPATTPEADGPSGSVPSQPLVVTPPHGSAGYFRWVALLGAAAAEALDHAHQLGVVHRDVKPGNLLLDRKGEVWVADFGLAKLAGDPTLTRTGDLVGTLRYMSPEQATGNLAAIDHRADVYGLGATLYELLALAAAFPGDDRQDVLRRIVTEDPPPPGRWQPSVPADLETIVLTCLAREPSQRYASAGELAADLRRFLDDQPILARRPSLAQRVHRWARRHRRPVVAGVVTAVLGVGLAFGVLLNRNAVIEREKNEARDQKERAVESMREMLRALDQVYLRVAESQLPRDPAFARADQAFLRQALGFYERFLEQNRDDPVLRQEAALAQLRVGELERRLGQHHEGAEAAGRAAALAQGLADEFPDRPEHRARLASAHESRALALAELGKSAEAEVHLARALELYQRLADESPDNPDYQSLLGRSLDVSSQWADRRRDLPEAIRLAQRAIGHQEAALRLRPEYPVYRRNLHKHLMRLGRLHDTRGEHDPAEKASLRSLALIDELANEYPRTLDIQTSLADSHKFLGLHYKQRRRYRDAEEHFRRGVAILEKATAFHANSPTQSLTLGDTYHELSGVLRSQGRPREAEEALVRALALAVELVRRYPDVRDYRMLLGVVHLALGRLRQATERVDEAERSYRQSQAVWDGLLAQGIDSPDCRHWLARVHNGLGELLADGQRAEEARRAYRLALEHLDVLRALWPDDPRLRLDLLRALVGLGDLLPAAGARDEAHALLRRAMALGTRPDSDNSDGVSKRYLLAEAHRLLGRLLDRPASRQEAERAYREAVAGFEKLVKEGGDSSRARLRLAESAVGLAGCLVSQERFEEGERQARRALVLVEKLLAEHPDRYVPNRRAGTLLNTLGAALLEQNKAAEAIPFLERAVTHQQTAMRLSSARLASRDVLAKYLANLCHAHHRRADHDNTVRVAERLSAEGPETAKNHRLAAACVARCLPLLVRDDRLSADRRRELEQSYGERAVRLLRRAADKGYDNVKELSAGPAFHPLWGRADYQQLVAELKAKQK